MAGHTSYIAGYINYMAFGRRCVLGLGQLCAGSLPCLVAPPLSGCTFSKWH
jgi:hypothetical protein